MKCDWADQQIISYVYGELSDEASHELELHHSACERCHRELQAFRGLRAALSFAPVQEPSPNLLAQCRIRLEEALDQLPAPSPWLRLHTALFGFGAQLRAAPGIAAGLALVGFMIGGMAGHVWKQQPQAVTLAAAAPSTAAQVFSVSGIVQHPETHTVDVTYNQIVPQTMKGSMDDPEVRKLLMAATQDGVDPTVQSNSVNLLASECRAKHFCNGKSVRTALMVALRYDRDASVRTKALGGLEPYVAQDMHVRDAILEALMNDPSPQVRSAAIQTLQPVQADSSVRMVMQTLADQDENPMVRNASEEVLRTMPTTE